MVSRVIGMGKAVRSLGRAVLAVLVSVIALSPDRAAAVPVALEFSFPGTFSVFGYLPVPQINGFDYAITPELVDSRLAGQSFTITSIGVTAEAVSLGARVNFDVEVHLSGSGIGLNAGQYTQTHIDPVAGHSRLAESQLLVVVGDLALTGPFGLTVNYDGSADSVSATPALARVKQYPVESLVLTDGLHAQLFFWTGDNRNVDIDISNVRLAIQGVASHGFPDPAAVAGPGSIVIVGLGISLLTLRRRS
jgi:hypothetical protein